MFLTYSFNIFRYFLGGLFHFKFFSDSFGFAIVNLLLKTKPLPCRLRGEVRDKIYGAEQAEGQAGGEGATGAGETDPLREQKD